MAELKLDTEFRYRAPWSAAPGVCRLRRFDSELGIFVVMSEMEKKNRGVSVTRSVEFIIRQASAALGLGIEDTWWIEHRVMGLGPGKRELHIFSRVQLGAGGLPEWEPLPTDLVALMLGSGLGSEDARV